MSVFAILTLCPQAAPASLAELAGRAEAIFGQHDPPLARAAPNPFV